MRFNLQSEQKSQYRKTTSHLCMAAELFNMCLKIIEIVKTGSPHASYTYTLHSLDNRKLLLIIRNNTVKNVT